MLKWDYRGFVLLLFMIGVAVVITGSAPVSAIVQNAYQIPYPGWNCYPNSYPCYYPGFAPSPGYNGPDYYAPCQQSYSNNVQCSGYVFVDPNGCTELTFTVTSPVGLLSSQYYTLHNLPSSFNANGSWVTVSGQLYQGSNFAPNGAACPGNYINVTSIS